MKNYMLIRVKLNANADEFVGEEFITETIKKITNCRLLFSTVGTLYYEARHDTSIVRSDIIATELKKQHRAVVDVSLELISDINLRFSDRYDNEKEGF